MDYNTTIVLTLLADSGIALGSRVRSRMQTCGKFFVIYRSIDGCHLFWVYKADIPLHI